MSQADASASNPTGEMLSGWEYLCVNRLRAPVFWGNTVTKEIEICRENAAGN